MNNFVAFDPVTHRVLIRGEGQWTRAEAAAYHLRMLDILRLIQRTERPITILADLDGLCIHPAEVARMLEDSVAIMAQFRIEAYALIVPSFLMRMQARRLLLALGCGYHFCETRDEAFAWLGWEADYQFAA